MCKIDLKNAYFSVPLHPESQKFVRFQWKGQLFQLSTISSNAMSGNNAVFHGERLRFKDKLPSGCEGRTELVGTKYSIKQR